VDDDDYIRIAIQDLLEDAGYTVFACADAFAAFELLSEEGIESIHLIIADIKMPHLNGLDFIRHIRKSREDIPIIVVSAHYETNYMEVAKELQVREFINKPFDNEKLLETIENIFHDA